MSDWQVGDLAVCVATSGIPAARANSGCSKGRIYRVERVVHWWGDLGLVVEGRWSDHPTGAFLASAFRKIRPDKHEGEASDWNLIVEQFGTKLPTETIVTVDRDGRAYLRDAA